MKTTKSLFLLTPLALLALTSCGSLDPAASSQTGESGQSTTSSSSYVEPTDPEGYFASHKKAREATSNKDSLRVYTPHANVKKGIEENGYITSKFGVHLNLDLGSLIDGADAISGLGLDNTEVDFVFDAKKIPFDYRDVGRKESDSSKRRMSFKDEIGEDSASVNVSFNGYEISTGSSLYTAIHIEDNLLFIDLSGLDSVYSLIAGSHLPGKGRVSFDLGDRDIDPGKIVDGLTSLNSLDETYSLPIDIGDLSMLDGIDFKELFDVLKNLDLELYKKTPAKNWTFQDSSITLSIQGEEELSDFLISLYKGNNPEYTEEELKEYQDGLMEALDMLVFDHAKTMVRFDENGMVYENYSFLISSFDAEKISEKIDLEGVKALYPVGEYTVSYGLAYEYNDVVPDVLTTKEKVKYEMVDSEAIITKLLDLLREFIPIGLDF